MKILIFTDAHFGENMNYEIIGGKEYVNVFGSQFPKLFNKLKLKFKKYDLIVNLGDSIFNKNKNTDVKRYKNFFNLFKGIKAPIEDIKKTKFSVIVYSHFLLTEQSSKDNYYFSPFEGNMVLIEERKEIRKILEKSKKVLLVLNGHTHFYHKEKIKGINYITVPSICENNGRGKLTGEYLELTIDKKNKIKEKLNKI